MLTREIVYTSKTGLGKIHAQMFAPEKPVAVLQIVHGMAEHIARYADFATYLANKGIAVVMHDQAGHGKSISQEDHRGYFGPQEGWKALIDDIAQLRKLAAEEFPGLPYVLMGHSMGSFLIRAYAVCYPKDFDALIISGTSGKNPILGIARIVAKRELKKNGPKKPSELLQKLSFGSYNDAFKPTRTGYDWLSRDEEIVDKYCADPLCGFAFSAEAMLDVLYILGMIGSRDWASGVPDVPILMFSGENDPVGGKKAKGVMQVYSWLTDSGHNVKLKLYPQGRHEMLNETNRAEVYEDVYSFIQQSVCE